jgi:hypothetical protein
MNAPPIVRWSALAALAVLGPGLASAPATVMADEVEVLTRGPVHEAFAETIVFNPQPTVVVTRECPAPITELPPDLKPEGANVTWIPGYWAWDDERSNFLWVSGIWRDLPCGRQWVPGYWCACEGGYRWTPGYWADAKVTEVEYLPEPPQCIENGPVEVAPSPDYVWIPGIWVWRYGHYAWRPGFWAVVQAGWTWIPDHYVCSPAGYVFVNGYWDYALDRRGTLFAPVCFNSDVFVRTAYVYSPTIVIGMNVFADHLFIRPNYCHYYFGDYYAVAYDRVGFYPCFAFHEHHGYDPIFAHERWEHRRDRDWDRHFAHEFQLRRERPDLRPPRTFAAQQSLVAHGGTANRNLMVATSLHQLAESHHATTRFLSVSKAESRELAHVAVKVQGMQHERELHESKPATRVTHDRAPAHSRTSRTPLAEHSMPIRTDRSNTKRSEEGSHLATTGDGHHSNNLSRFPKSPIVSDPSHLSREHLPPKAHVAPEPNLRIQAKPGQVRTGSPPAKPATLHRDLHPTTSQHHPAGHAEDKRKI